MMNHNEFNARVERLWAAGCTYENAVAIVTSEMEREQAEPEVDVDDAVLDVFVPRFQRDRDCEMLEEQGW